MRADRINLSGTPKESTIPIKFGLSLLKRFYFKFFNELICYLLIKPPDIIGLEYIKIILAPNSLHRSYAIIFILSSFSITITSLKEL